MSLTANPPGFYKDFLLAMLVKLFNTNIVYHHHNKGFSEFSKNRLTAFCYNHVFQNTNSILLSEKLYPDIKQYVSPQHVYYVPNGIKELTSSNLEKDMNPKLISILFLSNMMEAKGVYVLLNACEILKKRNILFQCHFIGSWADVTEIHFNTILEQKDLVNEVKALGPKYGLEKEIYFNSSQIFVFPTFFEIRGSRESSNILLLSSWLRREDEKRSSCLLIWLASITVAKRGNPLVAFKLTS
jgi:glycosyltransferase involved in cell wall biosynthesis